MERMTMMSNENTMDFGEWEDKFKPIKNWLNKNDPDAIMFETYGVEVGAVLGVNRFDMGKVWTLVEGDSGRLWISNGYHLVNRLGYFITENSFDGDFLDVEY